MSFFWCWLIVAVVGMLLLWAVLWGQRRGTKLIDETTKLSLHDRVRWWLYERCFAYCVHTAHPDADPDEFCLLDRASFVAIGRDEVQAIIEEAPDQAWRLESLLVHG